jgi:hypothetical protein
MDDLLSPSFASSTAAFTFSEEIYPVTLSSQATISNKTIVLSGSASSNGGTLVWGGNSSAVWNRVNLTMQNVNLDSASFNEWSWRFIDSNVIFENVTVLNGSST